MDWEIFFNNTDVFNNTYVFNFFLNNGDVENYGSFKSFGFIYIYIDDKIIFSKYNFMVPSVYATATV